MIQRGGSDRLAVQLVIGVRIVSLNVRFNIHVTVWIIGVVVDVLAALGCQGQAKRPVIVNVTFIEFEIGIGPQVFLDGLDHVIVVDVDFEFNKSFGFGPELAKLSPAAIYGED